MGMQSLRFTTDSLRMSDDDFLLTLYDLHSTNELLFRTINTLISTNKALQRANQKQELTINSLRSGITALKQRIADYQLHDLHSLTRKSTSTKTPKSDVCLSADAVGRYS